MGAGSTGLILAVAWLALAVTPAGCKPAEARGPQRQQLLARAVYWQSPSPPIERAVLGVPPDHAPALVTCRFKVEAMGGTTAKFDCLLPGGQEVRVKYGPSAELHAEVAATRLMRALGFPADDVGFVRTLRCYGCPPATFATMRLADALEAEGLVNRIVDYDDYTEFDWVTLERRFEAEPIEIEGRKGWTWFELPERFVAPASRTHVDALRLLAVFLAHWDNKSENQRLACLATDRRGGCARPVAMIQDVGATFGPHKVDLDDWRAAPIWIDRASCTIGMKGLPHDGATFAPVRISEQGRRFLADRLARLSKAQIAGLFSGARFDAYDPPFRRAHSIEAWVDAFSARVRAITDGPPCRPLS